jgi:hypothetical protein
MPLGVAYAM